jgi:HK97 gp10 family phage protein
MRNLEQRVAKRAAARATGKAAQLVKRAAKQNIERSPSIDTGSLRQALIVKKLGRRDSTLTSEHIVTVRKRRGRKAKGTQAVAPHALYVEFGTVNMPAEPFLRPALERNTGPATDVMVKTLEEEITKAGR